MLNTIYKITNSINDKVYIGKTSLTIQKRFQQHIRDSKKYLDRPLYKAFNKYGIENFKIEEIETNIPDVKINEKEQFYIKKFNSYHNGYNATLGGDGIKYKDYNIDEIIKLNQQGLSCYEIANRINLDRRYISNLLKANNIKVLSSKEFNKNKFSKKVYQLELETHKLLNIFNSVADASESLGKNRRNTGISRAATAARGHHRFGGYEWYYEEDYKMLP